MSKEDNNEPEGWEVKRSLLPPIEIDCSDWTWDMPEPSRLRVRVSVSAKAKVKTTDAALATLLDAINVRDWNMGGSGYRLLSTVKHNGQIDLDLISRRPAGAVERRAQLIADVKKIRKVPAGWTLQLQAV